MPDADGGRGESWEGGGPGHMRSGTQWCRTSPSPSGEGPAGPRAGHGRGVPSKDVAVGVCGDQVAPGVRRPRGIGLPGDGPGVPRPQSAAQEGPASSRSEP